VTGPTPRPHELTAMTHREVFDAPPADIDNAQDLARWHDYRDQYHRAQDLDGPDEWPLQLDVELNSKCNLRCAFCVHGQETVAKQVLDRDSLRRAILEGEEYGLVSMKWNYINEPLLDQDLPDWLTFAKDHGVLNTYFATNGTLLDEKWRGRLIDARLNKAMVSIDAATPEMYERMRGAPPKVYERVVRNVHALREDRERLGIGWPLIRVNFLRTYVNVEEEEAFRSMWEGVADTVGIQHQIALPGREDTIYERDMDLDSFSCSMPSKLMVIAANGNILPCCTFSGREMPVGNIRDTTIAEAWTSSRVERLREAHAAQTWRDNPVCRQCIYGDAPIATPETDATYAR